MMSYARPNYLGRKLLGTEVAYCFGEPIPSRAGQRVIPGVGPTVASAKAKRNAGKNHPSPRALQHMEWLVRWWSEPGETVFDPFMGSGATGTGGSASELYSLGVVMVGEES